MAADTTHHALSQPNNKEIKLWRYMDFTKFVSLISSKKIYLSRSDTFGDTFEGSLPKKMYDERLDAFFKSGCKQNDYAIISNSHMKLIESIYINCWHSNEHESAAMWNLYSKSNESIAIQTTYKKLENMLDNKIFMGEISYIDYEKDSFKDGDMLTLFMHKRKSFEHEKEVRIIKVESLKIKEKYKNNPPDKIPYDYFERLPLGINIDIDLNFIENIYVNPNAPEWFYELVKEICFKYDFKILNIKKSNLSDKPLY